jgi:hypothetical protein
MGKEVYSTTDYSFFKQITSNRELDERHVSKLVRAISQKNMLHLNPIILNYKNEVIDGQHRLAAAEKLGVKVFYVIDELIDKKDIASLNSNSKNWKVSDYINYWTIEKAPGFDKLSHFLYEYPKIPASSALILLSMDGKRDTSGLKNGHIDVSNYNHALMIANALVVLYNDYDFVFERNFILALKSCFDENPDFSFETLQKKISLQPRSFVTCRTVKQYLEMIEEIYNYKSQNKLRFIK